MVDDAVDQWQKRLEACIRAEGGHFEHLLLEVVRAICGLDQFMDLVPDTHVLVCIRVCR